MKIFDRVLKSILCDAYRLNGKAGILNIFYLFIKDPGFRLLALFRVGKPRGVVRGFMYLLFRALSSRRGILIPRSVTLGDGCNFGHAFNIIINKNAIIGKNCNFAHNVTIGSTSEQAPRLGDNIYIGPNSVIYGDIELGSNTVIGAGAIINKTFKGNCLIVGNPAVSKKNINDIEGLLSNVCK